MTHPLLSTHFITRGLPLKKAQQAYQKRRQMLMDLCPFPMVITGVSQTINAHNNWLMTREPFYQDPLFFFLTGINQPGAILILNPLSTTQPDILLLPKKNPDMEFWDGPQLGVGSTQINKDVTKITGIATVDWNHSIWGCLESIIKTYHPEQIGTFWHVPKRGTAPIKDDHYQFKHKCQRWLKANFNALSLVNIAAKQYQLRLSLDTVDINHMKTANAITTTTFKQIVSQMPTCQSEGDIHAIIAEQTLKHTWMGHSFPPIVAAGKNAQILHYHANNGPLNPNELLLIDMGVRYEGMPSDVTRTIPVNGTFNPLQALVYTIVLNAQTHVESLVKPGITINALNTACWDNIETHLAKELKLGKGKISRHYEKSPHNVSHLMGLSVHDGDPYRHYKEYPLEPGMVISNEPGFYGDIELTIAGKRYKESIGIRIEDNLLVTKTGCQNLTHCPKTISDIESLFI